MDVGDNIIFCTFYRSPNSNSDNDSELLRLISYLNENYKEQLIAVGDFNFSNIDWQSWTGSGNEKNIDEKVIDVLQKNGLKQFVAEPTRFRATDEPHVLDLIISRDDIVSNL